MLVFWEDFSVLKNSWGLLTLGLVIKRLSAQVGEPGWIGVMKNSGEVSDLGPQCWKLKKGKSPKIFGKIQVKYYDLARIS